MHGLLLFSLVMMSMNHIHSNRRPINGIFEGRLSRARNTAIASNIASAINSRKKYMTRGRNVDRKHIFVTPQQVNLEKMKKDLKQIRLHITRNTV